MEKDKTFNVNIKITQIKSNAHKQLRRAQGHEVSVYFVNFDIIIIFFSSCSYFSL